MNHIQSAISSYKADSIVRVALTGGPGGGKSSVMNQICDLLRSHDIELFLIPEAARMLRAAGLHPVNNPWNDPMGFQRAVIRTTLALEDVFLKSVSAMNTGKRQVVFICDRGIADGAAYVGREAFTALLKEFDMTYEQVLNRYDLVIALVSAADGAETHYVNDREREESLEEARELNTKTIAAWQGHNHLFMIDNSTDFPGKIKRALQALRRKLHIPMATEIERSWLVLSADLDTIRSVSTVQRDIIQTYLHHPGDPTIECRVRIETVNGVRRWIYTEKHLTHTPGVRLENEKMIDADQFRELIHTRGIHACDAVHKTRYSIPFNWCMLELDVYHDVLAGLIKLEVEFLSEEMSALFQAPGYLQLIEVTNDPRYSNRQLAQHGIPQEA